MLYEKLAPLLEVVIVIGELDGLGPAQKSFVGVQLQTAELVLLDSLPQQLHFRQPVHDIIISYRTLPGKCLPATLVNLLLGGIYNNMDIFRPYLQQAQQQLDCSIRSSEASFNHYIEYVDFPAFCLIYSLLLLWLLGRLNRQAIFRPRNKELISWKAALKKRISAFIVDLPIIKQVVARKFQKGLDDIERELYQDFEKTRDPTKSKKLPEEGMKISNIEARMKKWFEAEEKKMFSGKNSGAIYAETSEHCREVSDFAAKYMYHNPLHLDTYKEVSKMEAEVLRMTASLITKNNVYGVITSGGSESLIMSLYAYRKHYKRERPNIVVPNSIHAALDKGAMYFNVEVRKARLNENYEADVAHMRSLIDSNTIALYASYPNYPHGIIDPVNQIAALAKQHGIACHVDGCLGGFVAGFLKEHEGKFSLDTEGVTSVSLDHHKFALAPKGISNLFFKTKEMRQQMYFIYTDWVGGIYATPSFPGSRSGFASAGAWYALTHVGRKQYLENSMRVVEATKVAARDLAKIEGVRVIGNPELCVVAFQIDVVDCFNVSALMKEEKNWTLSALHIPKGLHVSVTLANCDNVKKRLANDVREAIENLIANPRKDSSTAAIYCASANIPSESMGEEMIRKVLSTTYK